MPVYANNRVSDAALLFVCTSEQGVCKCLNIRADLKLKLSVYIFKY